MSKSKIAQAASLLGSKKTAKKSAASRENGKAFAGRKPNAELLDACHDYVNANGGTICRRSCGEWTCDLAKMNDKTTFSSTVIFHLVREGRMIYTETQNFGQSKIGCEAKVV